MSIDYDSLLKAPAPPPERELTAAEKKAVEAFKKHFDADYKLDGTPLSDREKMWLCEETIMRFLKQCNGNAAEAIKNVEGTLQWRREMMLEDLDKTAENTERDARFGTRWISGWSKGKAVLYVFVNKNQLPIEERNQTHNVFMLERARDLSAPGQHEVCTIFNFGGPKEGPAPPVSGTREMTQLVQRHFPSVPTLSLMQDMGWTMKAFLNLIWPFMSAEMKATTHTKSGEQAIKDGLIERDGLIKRCGGSLDFDYDHATYWPKLIETCRGRREAYLANWQKLDDKSVGQPERLWKFVN